MLIAVTLRFPKGYIGHPYWPEREKLINIQKESGINRARSLDKREKALRAYLDSRGLTQDDYRALEAKANRQFHTDASDHIVIPAHHLHGMIAQGAAQAPGSIRLASIGQIRTVIEFSDFVTDKTKPDGVWDRFVTVKSGTGQALSNQRGLRSNEYIADFTASGSVRLVNDEAEKKAKEFVAYIGREIGVGASRKLGWGRFELVEWRAA